jgi:hypothetical protein
MPDYEPTIFISYAWGEETNEREAIVNQLDQSLQKRGLKIVRDKRDLGYKGSISKFMERIGVGDCVIVVISDKYLRSKNCMFELVEIAEGKQFAERIFPIILKDANIYDALGQLDYVEHWDKQKAALNERIRSLPDQSNLQGIREELDNYDRFRDEIAKLTTTLKDMNTLTAEMHREADFQQLYDELATRMPTLVSKEKPTTKKERKSMDPITLATAATSLLAPYIKKAGVAALDKIAEQLPDTVGKVWNAISNKSGNITEAASDLAKNPDDADNEVFFKKQLQKAFEKDQDFASLLTDLIEKAKSDPSINIGGDGVVAMNGSISNAFKTGGSITGSTINISSNVQSNEARFKK